MADILISGFINDNELVKHLEGLAGCLDYYNYDSLICKINY